MKIPDKIKIGGHEFKVEQEENSLLGMRGYNKLTKTIIIEAGGDIATTTTEEQLLNSILGAITLNYTLKVDMPVLHTLSECLYQVLRDNDLDFRSKPKLVVDTSKKHSHKCRLCGSGILGITYTQYTGQELCKTCSDRIDNYYYPMGCLGSGCKNIIEGKSDVYYLPGCNVVCKNCYNEYHKTQIHLKSVKD
jgi:hypothetical protein